MKRGDIVVAAGGTYASKPRPVIVLQSDLFDASDSVTVCPLTSTSTSVPLVRIPIPADATSGIALPSFAMVDKITTIRRSGVTEVTGRVTEEQLHAIERGLVVFLGVA